MSSFYFRLNQLSDMFLHIKESSTVVSHVDNFSDLTLLIFNYRLLANHTTTWHSSMGTRWSQSGCWRMRKLQLEYWLFINLISFMLAQTCWHCENQQTRFFGSGNWRWKNFWTTEREGANVGQIHKWTWNLNVTNVTEIFLLSPPAGVCTREEQQHRAKFDLCNWWYVSSQGKLDKNPTTIRMGNARIRLFFSMSD